jgi:hypothetical protein
MLVGNFGRRFQGKTTLGVWMLDQHSPRRAMLDPRGMIRRPGAVVVRSAAQLRRAFDALAADDCDEVVYTPVEEHGAALLAFAGEVRRWVVENPDLELGVLVDEATFYGRPGSKTALDQCAPFMFAMKSCDLDALHLVVTCHRPKDLSADVRALMNRMCFFRTTQEHDLDAIGERCSGDVVAIVQTLGDREFVKWNDDDGTFEVNRAPYVWKTDLTTAGASRSILVLQ